MQPDSSPFCSFFCRLLSELTVHFTEHIPVIFNEARTLPEGMQGWPESFFRKALIKNIDFFFRQCNTRRYQVGILLFIDFSMNFKLFQRRVSNRPGDPGAFSTVFKETGKRRDNTIR